MQALDTLTPALWRGYQRDTFPEGSWICEEGMLRTVAEAEPTLRADPGGARRPRRQEWCPLSRHSSAATCLAAWPGHAAAR